MPSKKKNKGNKLARMSDEERARYLQHRAELELEARRRKQQLIAIFTKNKLKHEEAFSRLNTAKINEQWRFILRKIKCNELHRDVEYLRQNFDNSLKCKNLIIERLYEELKKTDVDHRRLQEVHIETIDKSIAIYKQRLASLHDCYKYELQTVRSVEIAGSSKMRNSMIENMKNMVHTVNDLKNEFGLKLEETKTQNAINIHNIVYLKEEAISQLVRKSFEKMETLWNQLNSIILDYAEKTDTKRKQYEYLKEQDDNHQIETMAFPKLQMRLQFNIDNLKNDLFNLSKKRNETVKDLKNQSIWMTEKIWQLRHQFTVNQTTDKIQLKKLSIISNRQIKVLEQILDRGHSLQLMAKLCSYFKPLPPVTKNYQVYSTNILEEKTTQNTIIEPFDQMEKFWEKFNETKVDIIDLKRKKTQLITRNKQLRNILRSYLIKITKTASVA